MIALEIKIENYLTDLEQAVLRVRSPKFIDGLVRKLKVIGHNCLVNTASASFPGTRRPLIWTWRKRGDEYQLRNPKLRPVIIAVMNEGNRSAYEIRPRRKGGYLRFYWARIGKTVYARKVTHPKMKATKFIDRAQLQLNKVAQTVCDFHVLNAVKDLSRHGFVRRS